MAKKKFNEYVSPYPRAYSLTGAKPEALKTELTTIRQIRKDEGTLIWGEDDALPLHILNSIAQSPTATSCMGKIEMFTRGAAFDNPDLMSLVINKDGDTLWDLHCTLVQYYCPLDGFTVMFKYDSEGRITNAYPMNTAAFRFVAEPETEEITGLKYNPYFGSSEYRRHYTKEYSIFDLKTLPDEIKSMGTKFEGQVYFYGAKRPLYKHYPVPKFWAGKKWIYSDGKLSTYIDKMLDNGFFESVLMNVIGNPNAMSNHPDSMVEETGTDGIKRSKPTLTEGQIFDKMMGDNFSGVEKAAKALVTWSMNKDQAVTIQAFPSQTNFDFVSGTLRETIRMVSISMEVPGILSNLPDEVSPLSGGDAMRHAVDFMQSNTEHRRVVLENFYNNILLPNLQKPPKGKVKILKYVPVSMDTNIDQNLWKTLTMSEQRNYVKKNTDFELTVETPTVMNPVTVTAPLPIDPAPVVTAPDGTPIVDPATPTPPAVDENLKNMKVSEINRISSIVKKFETGKLTLEQAKQFLAGYGLSEEQQTAWLNPTI